MFHYMSGFASDISLEQHSKIYVFLLFPQKFAYKLDYSILSYSKNLQRDYHEKGRDPFMDGVSGLYNRYYPLTLPFKAFYCKDSGITIDDSEKPFIEWLESIFDVDLTDYLKNLSNRSLGNINNVDTIDNKNIFDFVSVAVEHQDFCKDVCEFVSKEEAYIKDFKYIHEINRFYSEEHITQHILDNSDYIKKNRSKLEFDELYDIEQKGIERFGEFFYNFSILSTMSFFISINNKTFKPCSKGGGNNDLDLKCVLEMNKLREKTIREKRK